MVVANHQIGEGRTAGRAVKPATVLIRIRAASGITPQDGEPVQDGTGAYAAGNHHVVAVICDRCCGADISTQDSQMIHPIALGKLRLCAAEATVDSDIRFERERGCAWV